MTFSPQEREALLAVKGVGPAVVARLEQMGFTTLAQLSEADVSDIVANAAALTDSTCWKTRAAITAAITLAKSHQ
ncbi:helix-hairpin-helix domain-containing protein [Pectobacterium aroidearum]|uniref:helix-hairpin-helix domain-containing protein n=1 Tax=Pectobacterium aroidearum TaxID=1201031 RepID=UPI002114AE85|nr:helix-hairpin-helix domain-containing protein [Pectobacterium aroidearum]UUE44225.1 helix-hairpin-helix domain-containing protein [Pectobacterium aroidearum]UUE48443.1 helix-hairpin-helix domain-containing protein [Pectobacterium aroidearum]UUE52648.1 helix-hairpin-helix domain-containing protein [Pectobacterium aroidearum]UUE61059.1 helix-hairpin-helix domain-containing protein [Pectobacterium aroidearum]UUE65281.1 helix-hairpin-helix domain-containing protein [Pectobacterium aroidearum]